MMNIKNILTTTILTILIIGITGCTATAYKKYEKNSEIISDRIQATVEKEAFKKVKSLDTPPNTPKKIEEEEKIGWLDKYVSQKSNNVALSIVLNQIMRSTGVKIDYDYDVDPNKRVSINFEGTIEAALKLLSIQADVFIHLTPNEIVVQRYIVKTFTLPVLHGESGYQLGSASSSSASNEDALEGSISATGAGDGQYTQFSASKTNATDDLRNGIKAILKKNDSEDLNGSVEMLNGISSVVVRTTPTLMQKVNDFVNAVVAEMTKQVILEIEVVEFQQTEGTEFGLDGLFQSGSLTLTGSSTQITDSGVAGLLFSDDSSDALLRYLKQYGTVSITTRQIVRAQNQQIQEVDLSDVRSYISETTIDYDDDGDASVDIDVDTVRDGVKMIVAASIYDDNVFLRINGTLIKFVYFDTQEIEDVTISTPRTRQSRFNVGGKFEYNRPVLLTSMKQIVEQSQNDNVLEFVNSNSGEKKVVNTFVLVTPRLSTEK